MVAAVRRTACCHRWRFLRGARAGVKGVFDPLAADIFLAADAMHIDALQDVHAGARAGGDLGGRAAGVQPQGQGCVPQVVRAAGQWGGCLGGAERGLAGGMPDAAVDRFAERAAAGAAEQRAV